MPDLQALILCSELAAAAARVAQATTSQRPWRERAHALVEAAATLAGDVAALRAIHSPTLRAHHAVRITKSAEDASALGMRMHNLLPHDHPGRAAAFDVAASATALGAAVQRGVEAQSRAPPQKFKNVG